MVSNIDADLGDIGREATDAIMIQAAYSFSEGMTMSQAALLFLQADTLYSTVQTSLLFVSECLTWIDSLECWNR